MTLISTGSTTQLSEPSAALAHDLFPTTPGPLICIATRGATRVDDDDDDDDDDNDAAAAGDDDSALLFSA